MTFTSALFLGIAGGFANFGAILLTLAFNKPNSKLKAWNIIAILLATCAALSPALAFFIHGTAGLAEAQLFAQMRLNEDPTNGYIAGFAIAIVLGSFISDKKKV